MSNISVICIVKYKHPRLFEVLASIREIASEIIIADTGIDQELRQELLSIKKLKIIRIEKIFSFAELLREDLKSFAKEEFILFVDHDEVVPPTLKKYILENYQKYDYIAIPRKNIIFNKWIKHSRWWPDYQIRFIKKDKVHWGKDIDIHKQPKLMGNGLTIPPKEELAFIHYNYENIDEYINKALHYAKQEAKQLIRKNKKLTLSQTITSSISEFVSRFFAHEGYKDGVHGFTLAVFQMFYFFLVFFYYWEFNKYFELDSKDLAKESGFFFKKGLAETSYWLVKKDFVSKMGQIKLRLMNKILSFFD